VVTIDRPTYNHAMSVQMDFFSAPLDWVSLYAIHIYIHTHTHTYIYTHLYEWCRNYFRPILLPALSLSVQWYIRTYVYPSVMTRWQLSVYIYDSRSAGPKTQSNYCQLICRPCRHCVRRPTPVENVKAVGAVEREVHGRARTRQRVTKRRLYKLTVTVFVLPNSQVLVIMNF